MKLLIPICILCLSIPQLSFSQQDSPDHLNYGVKAGKSFYSFSEDAVEPRTDLSFYAGGFVSTSFSSKLKLQTELLFEAYNLRDNNFFNIETNILQLSVPVFVKFEALPNLFLNAGGFAGYRIDVNTDGDNIINNNLIKDWDAGLLTGADYHFDNGLFLEIRYNYGLVDIQNQPQSDLADLIIYDSEIKTRSFFIGVGFQF